MYSNREVASKPDSGASWVCYMAYWLGLGNVDKARLTARRALDTINYRFFDSFSSNGLAVFIAMDI